MSSWTEVEYVLMLTTDVHADMDPRLSEEAWSLGVSSLLTWQLWILQTVVKEVLSHLIC